MRPGTLCALALAWMVCLTGGSARADVDLWPLFESSDEGTTVLYPFYVHEGKFLMLFPFYYRTNEGRDHHVLWPITKVSDGRLERVAPIWFSDTEDSFTLLPLLHRTPQYTLWLAPPVYLDRAGEYQAVAPLYFRAKHDLWTLPWYHRGRDPARPATDSLFPLFHSSRGTDASTFWILPFYYASQDQKAQTSSLWVLPYYQQRSQTRKLTGVLGLWESLRDGDTRSLFVLPWYQVRSPTRQVDALFPFFWSSRENLQPGDRTRRYFWTLWPLYGREEVRAPDGSLVSRHRRFLAFTDELSEERKRIFRLLGIAVVERTQ